MGTREARYSGRKRAGAVATEATNSAAMSSDKPENRFWQFSKTKMCKFEVLGRCKKGRECPFAHASVELRALPDLRCTKLCKSLILTGICADPSCGYAHSKEELRSTGAFHKTKLCRFMQTGHCALGTKCNFAHSSFELRDADEAIPEVDEQEEEDVQDDIPLPPGLGWQSSLIYDGDGRGATENDLTDWNGLAQALDVMLSQVGQVEESIAQATTLSHDAPAYIRLPSAPDAWRFSQGFAKEPAKANGQLGQLNLDYLNGDQRSTSTTRSPPSPPSPPSDSGSGRSSGKTSNPAALIGAAKYADKDALASRFYNEGFPSGFFEALPGAWDPSAQACAMDGFGTLGGFGSGPYGSYGNVYMDPYDPMGTPLAGA